MCWVPRAELTSLHTTTPFSFFTTLLRARSFPPPITSRPCQEPAIGTEVMAATRSRRQVQGPVGLPMSLTGGTALLNGPAAPGKTTLSATAHRIHTVPAAANTTDRINSIDTDPSHPVTLPLVSVNTADTDRGHPAALPLAVDLTHEDLHREAAAYPKPIVTLNPPHRRPTRANLRLSGIRTRSTLQRSCAASGLASPVTRA